MARQFFKVAHFGATKQRTEEPRQGNRSTGMATKALCMQSSTAKQSTASPLSSSLVPLLTITLTLRGTSPCKLFQLRFSVSSEESLPSSGGTGPTRSLEFKNIFLRLLRLPRDGGISPVSWFPCRKSSSRLCSCPRDSGIAPGRIVGKKGVAQCRPLEEGDGVWGGGGTREELKRKRRDNIMPCKSARLQLGHRLFDAPRCSCFVLKSAARAHRETGYFKHRR